MKKAVSHNVAFHTGPNKGPVWKATFYDATYVHGRVSGRVGGLVGKSIGEWVNGLMWMMTCGSEEAQKSPEIPKEATSQPTKSV